MANIIVGSALVIDDGTAQETVTVTAVSATTFTAVTVNAHDGTTTPFAIVSQSFPNIGQGWLNFLIGSGWLTNLPAQPGPDPATAAGLAAVLKALADFAVMKQALSPADGTAARRATEPVGRAASEPGGGAAARDGAASQQLCAAQPDRVELASVNALLTRFFGSTNPASLSSVENLRRVYDAYAIVTSLRPGGPGADLRDHQRTHADDSQRPAVGAARPVRRSRLADRGRPHQRPGPDLPAGRAGRLHPAASSATPTWRRLSACPPAVAAAPAPAS